jgi:hypothetical protein
MRILSYSPMSQEAVSTTHYDIVVVGGASPYGLVAYQNAPVLHDRFESIGSRLSSVSRCVPLYRYIIRTQSAAQRVATAAARQVERIKLKEVAHA